MYRGHMVHKNHFTPADMITENCSASAISPIWNSLLLWYICKHILVYFCDRPFAEYTTTNDQFILLVRTKGIDGKVPFWQRQLMFVLSVQTWDGNWRVYLKMHFVLYTPFRHKGITERFCSDKNNWCLHYQLRTGRWWQIVSVERHLVLCSLFKQGPVPKRFCLGTDTVLFIFVHTLDDGGRTLTFRHT